MNTLFRHPNPKNRKYETINCFPSICRGRYHHNTHILIVILITLSIYNISLMPNPPYVEPPDLPPQIYAGEYLRYEREAGLPIDVHETPVLQFKTPVRGEDNIIFLHTTCVALEDYPKSDVTTELSMTYQQVCAVESAAKMNPKSKVYLLYTCPLDSDSLNRSSELIRRLLEYSNVHIWHQTLSDFFHGTPLDKFYKSGQMQKSKYRLSHTSDVLRYLSLWKFGGIYLDLDFIITKPLDGLGKNFAGAESEDYVASGAMGMTVDGIGKEIAATCVESLRTDFRGDIWVHNGPLVITRAMKKKCAEEKTSLMTPDKCGGFQVHNVSVFYAVNAYDWKHFFSEEYSEVTMANIKNSYAVHLWNSMEKLMYEQFVTGLWNREIKSRRMHPRSKQPVALLREQYCPLVYSHIVVAEKINHM